MPTFSLFFLNLLFSLSGCVRDCVHACMYVSLPSSLSPACTRTHTHSLCPSVDCTQVPLTLKAQLGAPQASQQAGSLSAHLLVTLGFLHVKKAVSLSTVGLPGPACRTPRSQCGHHPPGKWLPFGKRNALDPGWEEARRGQFVKTKETSTGLLIPEHVPFL